MLLPLVSSYELLLVNQEMSHESPYIIENPEATKELFLQIKEKPNYLQIENTEEISLKILFPYSKNTSNDFLINIYLNNELKETIFSEIPEEKYYDKSKGILYLKGPEINLNEKGIYIFEFSSEEENKKYIIYIGEKTKMSSCELFKIILILPKLKMHYFEKSFFSVFKGSIGKIIFLFQFILTIFFITCVFIWRKWKQKGGSFRNFIKNG